MQRVQPSDQPISLAVGYSVLRTGTGDTLRACVVIPHVDAPRALTLDQGAMRLVADVGATSTLLLAGMPEDIVRLAARHPDRVLLLNVDTLSRARAAMPCVSGQAVRPSTPAQDLEAAARTAFNSFLNHAVAAGSVHAENHRVRTRQPQTEAFVRRSLAVVKKLAPASVVGVTACSVKASACGAATTGPLAVAQLTAQLARTRPGLADYLEPPARDAGTAPGLGLSELDLFALLHSCAPAAMHRHFGLKPGLTQAPIAAVCDATGLSALLPEAVGKAADSVFGQSFADAYAVALYAARRGKEAALALVASVRATRAAAGDYDIYALAPLSHDTKATLSIMATTLQLCGDAMSSMSGDELFEQSRFAAIEGLAAWMQQHGADYDLATQVIQSMQRLAGVLASKTTSGTA